MSLRLSYTFLAPFYDLIAGPAPFSQSDRQRFANHLDHFVTRRPRVEG